MTLMFLLLSRKFCDFDQSILSKRNFRKSASGYRLVNCWKKNSENVVLRDVISKMKSATFSYVGADRNSKNDKCLAFAKNWLKENQKLAVPFD